MFDLSEGLISGKLLGIKGRAGRFSKTVVPNNVFLRTVPAPNGRHQYLRLVESFRDGDEVRQRVVAHLGRKDLLAPPLDAWIRLLQDESSAPRWIPAAELSTPRASTWGPILVARRLFEKLSLGTILDAGRKSLRHGEPLSERVFALQANRLTRPGSEHALAPWLENFYVCTAAGSRWMPVWKQARRVNSDTQAEPADSGHPGIDLITVCGPPPGFRHSPPTNWPISNKLNFSA